MKFVSPVSLQRHALAEYCNGKNPKNRDEWALVINYWAANIAVAESEACVLLARIFKCPLTEMEIREIAAYQTGYKAGAAGRKEPK